MADSLIHTQTYKSPVGELLVGSFNNQLVLCDWKYRKMRDTIDARIQTSLQASYHAESSLLIETTIHQLEEYFKKKRSEFDLPVHFVGTAFQKSVWRELQKVAFGTTESYLGLSKKLNNAKAIRAVASANGANAISIIVPCHRIIGSKGELTGYAGGLTSKKKLLELEGVGSQQLGLF